MVLAPEEGVVRPSLAGPGEQCQVAVSRPTRLPEYNVSLNSRLGRSPLLLLVELMHRVFTLQ